MIELTKQRSQENQHDFSVDLNSPQIYCTGGGTSSMTILLTEFQLVYPSPPE